MGVTYAGAMATLAELPALDVKQLVRAAVVTFDDVKPHFAFRFDPPAPRSGEVVYMKVDQDDVAVAVEWSDADHSWVDVQASWCPDGYTIPGCSNETVRFV